MKNDSALAAKAIKAELKAAFPSISFSVTSDNYTGGCSVNISYQDGVLAERVRDIVAKYQRGDKSRSDIYQVTSVFVTRTISVETQKELAWELGIAVAEIDKFNSWEKEYNSALIWQLFCTREYGVQASVEAPAQESDTNAEPTSSVITEGKEVDYITDVFDAPGANAIDVPIQEVEAAIRSGSKVVSMIPEKDLNWELKDFADYPTNVSFYCVLEDFPKGKILSISDAYLPTSKEWVPVEKLFQPSEFEIWSPAQIVQYLVDTFGALKFTILVEDQHGRQKNPDYHQFDIIAPLNN